MANRFPNQYEKFKDTRGAGGITIEGVQLDVDENGFIEAPIGFEDALAGHGFLRLNGPAYVAWERKLPKKSDATVAVSGLSASGAAGKAR